MLVEKRKGITRDVVAKKFGKTKYGLFSIFYNKRKNKEQNKEQNVTPFAVFASRVVMNCPPEFVDFMLKDENFKNGGDKAIVKKEF